MQIACSTTPQKVSLQNWKPIFPVISRILNIEQRSQTSLKFACVRFWLFFVKFKELKTLYWENKNLYFRYFGCLNYSLYHGLNLFLIILNFWWCHRIGVRMSTLIVLIFVYIFFSRILVDFANLNIRKTFFKRHLRK